MGMFEGEFNASGAEFSECRRWRYALWRRWSWSHANNQLVVIGLNPSTADESANDPTIRRCINFAKGWNYDGLIMLNAYAWRATDPKQMKIQADPVGPGNDEAIKRHCRIASPIIAAWGVHCSEERALEVCKLVGGPVHCLGKTKAGAPKHPLYLKADTRPEIYWQP